MNVQWDSLKSSAGTLMGYCVTFYPKINAESHTISFTSLLPFKRAELEFVYSYPHNAYYQQKVNANTDGSYSLASHAFDFSLGRSSHKHRGTPGTPGSRGSRGSRLREEENLNSNSDSSLGKDEEEEKQKRKVENYELSPFYRHLMRIVLKLFESSKDQEFVERVRQPLELRQ
jgi:hypothetical protein